METQEILGTYQTFSIGFSFIRTESCEDFNFIHQQMGELVSGSVAHFPKLLLQTKAKE